VVQPVQQVLRAVQALAWAVPTPQESRVREPAPVRVERPPELDSVRAAGQLQKRSV
jgi:hypothetical protein